MARKKFFSAKIKGTETTAIAMFFSKAKSAGITVKRFSIVPVYPLHPNAESGTFQVTALEAY